MYAVTGNTMMKAKSAEFFSVKKFFSMGERRTLSALYAFVLGFCFYKFLFYIMFCLYSFSICVHIMGSISRYWFSFLFTVL